jgi:50S ribosomal subunit-associated GTPase HflX
VLNKVDRLPEGEVDAESVRSRVLGSAADPTAAPIAVSATTGQGLPELVERIDRMLPLDPVARAVFRIPHGQGSAVHFLHEHARVLETRNAEEYAEIVADVPESVRKRLSAFLVDRGDAGTE